MDEQTFAVGTVAECNRCGKTGPLPKDCAGHLETPAKYTPGRLVYRLDTMCILPCGHMDAHWVTIQTQEV